VEELCRAAVDWFLTEKDLRKLKKKFSPEDVYFTVFDALEPNIFTHPKPRYPSSKVCEEPNNSSEGERSGAQPRILVSLA
jgi:hypothetical protein